MRGRLRRTCVKGEIRSKASVTGQKEIYKAQGKGDPKKKKKNEETISLLTRWKKKGSESLYRKVKHPNPHEPMRGRGKT